MEALRIRTRTGGSTELPADHLEAFASGLGGALARPGDGVYTDCLDLWNATIERSPAAVVRCAGTADVVRAVELARRHDLLVSLRSAGHNIAGSALCDDGLVIDLSKLTGVRVDPEARTVRAEPGATWADLDREAQLFGLAVPGGIVSTTGIAGLTLGGGFGWLTRKHGLTCDNLLSADVVTADGEVRRASPHHDADLLWALRGGGGNFGVVTSFEYRAHPVGPEVLAGMVLFPLERGMEVGRFFRRFAAEAPRELGSLLILRQAPPAPFLPKEIHGAPVAALAFCYAGPVEEAEEVLAPLAELGEPLGGGISPRPFAAHNSFLDGVQPHGRRYYWKSEYVDAVGDDLLAHLVDCAGNLTSPDSAILVKHLGGAAVEEPEGGAAAAHREAPFLVNLATSWRQAGEGERHVEWTRDAWRGLREHSTVGTYVNFLTEDEGDDRLRAAYGDALPRLRELKRRYDPDGLFRGHPPLGA